MFYFYSHQFKNRKKVSVKMYMCLLLWQQNIKMYTPKENSKTMHKLLKVRYKDFIFSPVSLTFSMGAFSSQISVLWSGLRKSVAHTLLSRPPEYTVVNESLACNAHTLSSWTRSVAIHLCWPSDHSRIVPSELPDKHCNTVVIWS